MFRQSPRDREKDTAVLGAPRRGPTALIHNSSRTCVGRPRGEDGPRLDQNHGLIIMKRIFNMIYSLTFVRGMLDSAYRQMCSTFRVPARFTSARSMQELSLIGGWDRRGKRGYKVAVRMAQELSMRKLS